MKNRGFTLVEVMLAAAITSILVALLVSIAGSVSSAWSRGESQAEASANARGALNLLTRELQSAVIDLDLGFRVSTVTGEPNQFVLKFLTRAEPEPDKIEENPRAVLPGTSAVRKVCYQVAWADQRLLPRVESQLSTASPVPVLLRTESQDLSDVFEVKTGSEPDRWTLDWGTLKAGGSVSAGATTGLERVDIAAEHVLGWQVIPYAWDGKRIVPDRPDATGKFYDRYLTSDKAPRALEIKLAVLPARAAVRASQFTESWQAIRKESGLFNIQRLANTPLNEILRRDVKYFSTTVYLQSKTP